MRSTLSISIIALVALSGCGKGSGELDEQQAQIRQAVQKLGAQVSGTKSITVRFTNSDLTGKDLEPLSKLGKVNYLDLSNTNIGDDGMVHVAKLEGLQVLRMRGTQITDAGFSQLNNLSELNQLTANEQMGDGTLAVIAKAPNLNFLDLGGTQITDDGLAALQQMKKLKRLTLSRTAITDKGLEHVQSLSILSDLQLNNTAITDDGLLLLEGLSNLNVLAITGTGTTLNGITKLATALPDAEFDTGASRGSPMMQGGPPGGGRPGGGRPGGGGPPDLERIVGFMMRRLDTDEDGEISKEEIDASDNPDRTRALDANEDGKITREEMLKALEARLAAGGGGRPGGGAGRPGAGRPGGGRPGGGRPGGDSGSNAPNESPPAASQPDSGAAAEQPESK